jgi:uncharacterized protein YoxC
MARLSKPSDDVNGINDGINDGTESLADISNSLSKLEERFNHIDNSKPETSLEQLNELQFEIECLIKQTDPDVQPELLNKLKNLLHRINSKITELNKPKTTQYPGPTYHYMSQPIDTHQIEQVISIFKLYLEDIGYHHDSVILCIQKHLKRPVDQIRNLVSQKRPLLLQGTRHEVDQFSAKLKQCGASVSIE